MFIKPELLNLKNIYKNNLNIFKQWQEKFLLFFL